MIQSPIQISKRIGWLLLCGLLGSALFAASLPQQELPACSSLLEEVKDAFNVVHESGRGNWADLDPLVARARRCFGDARTSDHAVLLNYETSILVKQRRFAEAEPVFVRYFSDYAAVDEPVGVATMHLRRGYVYRRFGWTAEMLAEYARAAAMAPQLPAPEAANTLLDAGAQYRVVNDLETAARFFAEAESLLVRLHAEDPAAHSRPLGIVRLRRARVLLDEEEQRRLPTQEAISAAVPLLESALQLLSPTPADAFQRTVALLYRTEVYWLQGTPEAALAPIAEAHGLRPWLHGYPQLEAHLWRKEAYTHYLLGQYPEAAQDYERALALARAAEERVEERQALLGLGDVAEASRTHEGLRRAEGYYRQAAAVAEATRRSYGTHDWSAAAWERMQEPHRNLTRVLLRQGRVAEAFLTLDETRARYLRDLRTAARLRTRLDLRGATQLDSLTTAIEAVRDTLRDVALPLGARSALEVREIDLQQRLDALIDPDKAATETLTLEAVQRALRPRGQVLLTYFLDDDLPTAFVVRSDTLAAVPLRATADSLQAQIHRLGGEWTEDGVPEAALRLTPLHALYEAIYAPVAPLVPAGAPLVVIPEEPLAQVPFGLLLERTHPPFGYADAPYLLRHHAVTVELAAALLAEPAAPADLPLDLLALGRSRFAADGPGARSDDTLSDLPNVREELRRLHRRLGNARLGIDAEATEAFFDAHRDEARVIHLASHAFVDPRQPLYSHIVLASDPAREGDGLLHLYELQNRPLHADLVTLSGCSTARGRRHVGEGMMGLQYAFRAAGARATLATLWQVDDRATAFLMDRFYRHLRADLPKDEALRRAQLDYLERHDGRDASPFFWAAAVLYGDPAPVVLTAGAPSAALWVPVGLLLLLAGIALPRAAARMRGRKKG